MKPQTLWLILLVLTTPSQAGWKERLKKLFGPAPQPQSSETLVEEAPVQPSTPPNSTSSDLVIQPSTPFRKNFDLSGKSPRLGLSLHGDIEIGVSSSGQIEIEADYEGDEPGELKVHRTKNSVVIQSRFPNGRIYVSGASGRKAVIRNSRAGGGMFINGQKITLESASGKTSQFKLKFRVNLPVALLTELAVKAYDGGDVSLRNIDFPKLVSLYVENSFGKINAKNLSLAPKGVSQFKAGSGDISVIGLNSTLVADAEYGKAFVSGTLGSVMIRSGSGDVDIKNTAKDVAIIAEYGAVSAIGNGGSIHIEAGTGNASVKNVAGDASINCEYGKVRLAHVRGASAVNAETGDIVGHDLQDANMTSSYGSIKVSGSGGAIVAETGIGSILFDNPDAESETARTEYGYVRGMKHKNPSARKPRSPKKVSIVTYQSRCAKLVE